MAKKRNKSIKHDSDGVQIGETRIKRQKNRTPTKRKPFDFNKSLSSH